MARNKNMPMDEEHHECNDHQNDQHDHPDKHENNLPPTPTDYDIPTRDGNVIHITNVKSIEERVSSSGEPFLFIKKSDGTGEIVMHLKGRNGQPGTTARIILDEYALDPSKMPEHMKQEVGRHWFELFRNFKMELEKDPVKKAEFERQVAELRKEKKRK